MPRKKRRFEPVKVKIGTNKDVEPQKGDIVASLKSGTEYVFYEIRDRLIARPTEEVPEGNRQIYPVFLMEKENGRLSKPFVVVDGFDGVEFVERGAPREPGEKPVRSLKRDPQEEKTTMRAPDGRL